MIFSQPNSGSISKQPISTGNLWQSSPLRLHIKRRHHFLLPSLSNLPQRSRQTRTIPQQLQRRLLPFVFWPPCTGIETNPQQSPNRWSFHLSRRFEKSEDFNVSKWKRRRKTSSWSSYGISGQNWHWGIETRYNKRWVRNEPQRTIQRL